MMYEEFTDRASKIAGFEVKVTDRNYKDIETVYNYHPSISDKDDIALIYVRFGMRAIRDMLPTALVVAEYEQQQMALKHQLEELTARLEEIFKGDPLTDKEKEAARKAEEARL